MRYGHFMGYGYNGMFIMMILLILVLLLLILVMRGFAKKPIHQRTDMILEVLKHRYVTNEITAGQYMEMKRVIETEYSDQQALFELKESFARGRVSLEEYREKKKVL
ncbi:MAG: hypothetical protein ACM3UZ_14060 [Acidobacteriota bacterium]